MITISGERLLAGGNKIVSVALDGTDVYQIVSSTNSEIVVVADAHFVVDDTLVEGGIAMVADTDAFVNTDGGWTYLKEGAIDTVLLSED